MNQIGPTSPKNAEVPKELEEEAKGKEIPVPAVPQPEAPENKVEKTSQPEMVIEDAGQTAQTIQTQPDKSSPKQLIDLGEGDVTSESLNTIGQARNLQDAITEQNDQDI